MGCSET
ncbi:hypothetical protein CP02DC14_1183A, partial [Chlamydia psittaci 02DC14]